MRHLKTALLGLALVASPLITSSGAAATPGGGMKAMGSPNCDRGYFCVWQDVDYNGYKASFQGDDNSWLNNGPIHDGDSSWVNHGITGPGIPDHVKVFDGSFQNGAVTICLGPGDEVHYNPGANDRGASHTWTMGC